jgi:hypothetical protein
MRDPGRLRANSRRWRAANLRAEERTYRAFAARFEVTR